MKPASHTYATVCARQASLVATCFQMLLANKHNIYKDASSLLSLLVWLDSGRLLTIVYDPASQQH